MTRSKSCKLSLHFQWNIGRTNVQIAPVCTLQVLKCRAARSNRHALATAPELYPVLVKSNAHQSLLELLKHENADIAIDLIDLFHDLFDPEMLDDAADEADVLIEALLAQDFLPLLMDNLGRLDESSDEQAEGIHNVLGIVENLIELKPSLADVIVAQTSLLKWLLNRVAARSKTFHPNRLYASEILAMLLQTSGPNQQALAGEGVGGVDSLLVAAAGYKKKDPVGEEEQELCENVFQCLCSALLQPVNKSAFRESEGIELMLLIIREKKYGRKCAVKVLDYVLTNDPQCCDQCVDAGGLKSIFPVFMGKSLKKKYHDADEMRKVEELGVSILGSLFKFCTGERMERLVGKFSESECEKVDRLIELWCKSSFTLSHPPFVLETTLSLRRPSPSNVSLTERLRARTVRYSDKLQQLDGRYAAADAARAEDPRWQAASEEEQAEHEQDDKEERYFERLDAGLYTLQTLAALLASIWVGNEEAKARALMLLNQQSAKVEDVKAVLEDYAVQIGDKKIKEAVAAAEGGAAAAAVGGGEDDAEAEAAAAAEAESIRALASVLT